MKVLFDISCTHRAAPCSLSTSKRTPGKVNSVDPAARIPNLLDTAYWTEVVRQNWAGGASNQLARVDSRSIFHPCSCQPDTCRSDGDQVCDLACNCEFRKPPTSLHSVNIDAFTQTQPAPLIKAACTSLRRPRFSQGPYSVDLLV